MWRSICVLAIVLAFVVTACGQSTATQPSGATAPTLAAQEEQNAATAPTESAVGATSPTAFVEGATAEPASTQAAEGAAETAAPAGVGLEQIQIGVELVTNALDRPIYATHAGDGSGRMFVVEKVGRVQAVRDGTPEGTPFLDITDRVGARGSEQGLLSIAFHPRFAENGRVFVNYTDQRGDTVISRFESKQQADPASEVVLLKIDQPYPNHNGGLVKFGPDGYLYIGMGDGGSGGDPQNNGQNPRALLGKMLRIDVDNGDPYAIPADNPWADGGAGAPEAWAMGLRNPWRFSFDRKSGDLYIGDVGQNAIEEISFQAAGSGAGANYGWNVTEGSECYRRNCDPSQFVAPIGEYRHEFGCSVTGGYVYQGSQFPALQGTYLFGDYCSGRVWGLQQNGQNQWAQRELLQSELSISSFGEDEAGELYITSLGDNGLYRVVAQ